jgi:hypothetical protein
MGINKKGFFFTTIAILVVSLFLISLAISSQIKDRTDTEKRIESMDTFVFSLEKDISRQVYISGYRAILSTESYITGTGKFLNDSESSIKEALINGTISNESMNMMEGFILKDWESRTTNLGNKVNVYVNYSINSISVTQEDPWNVLIETNINLSVTDKGNLASWEKTETIKSKIEVIGFEDPIYLIGTNGPITNKINKTVFQPFANGTDVSNLTAHLTKSYYTESTGAPSFLMRLEGNLNPSPNGIESLVYIPKLTNQSIQTSDKSLVDYIYFSQANPTSYRIQGMPSWFKLDDAHITAYNLTSLKIP